MTDSILISIFLSFPEAIFVLLLGLSLCNIKIDPKKVILITSIQALLSFVIKLIHIPFGIHSIVQLITFWLLVMVILKIKFYKAIIPILIGFFVDIIIQQILISVANLLIKLDFSRLGIEFKYTLIYSLFAFIIFLIVLFIIRKTRFIFCDLSVEGESIGEQK